MILFLRELNTGIKSLMIWVGCIAVLLFASMAMFPSFSNDAEGLNQLLQNFPDEMLKALNMSNLNLADSMDYFTYIFQYVLLFGAIEFMLIGAGLLSKETGEKTIEFLYAKPITKNYIITAKYLSALVQAVIFNVAGYVFSVISLAVFAEDVIRHKLLILLWVSVFLTQIFFLSVGFIISVFISRYRQVMPVSLGVVLGLYFIGMITSISEAMAPFKYLTPFQYFDGLSIVRNAGINSTYLFACLLISLISIIATYVCYNKKDIYV